MIQNYPEFVSQRLSPNHQILHVAIGLIGEWYEYKVSNNQLNKIEELGDCCYYLQAGQNIFLCKSLFFEPAFLTHEVFQSDIDSRLHEFLDLVKKQEIYGNKKPLSMYFLELCLYMSTYINQQGVIQHIISDNMKKLSERYKSTFTPEESEARKDKE